MLALLIFTNISFRYLWFLMLISINPFLHLIRILFAFLFMAPLSEKIDHWFLNLSSSLCKYFCLILRLHPTGFHVENIFIFIPFQLFLKFKISIVISHLTHGLIRSMLLNFHFDLWRYFILLISNLILLSENILCKLGVFWSLSTHFRAPNAYFVRKKNF